MEDELFQSIDQMLLCSVSIWLLKKFNDQPLGISIKVNDSVVPDMRHIIFFQLGSKNFQISIREIVNIIGLLADRLIVCVDHRKHRFEDSHPLLVFYVLRCRNAIKAVYLLVCIPDQLSLYCEPSNLRLI